MMKLQNQLKMSTNSGSIQLNLQTVQNIISKRKIIRITDADSLVKLHIQGNGNMITVINKDGDVVMGSNGQPLQKMIYNVNANSHIAMMNPNNQQLLRDACEAARAADDVKAHELFNQYLNKIQVSFSFILSAGSAKFTKDELVKGTVQVITTDNGQLITLDKVSAVEAKTLAATPKLSLDELMGLTAEGPTPENLFTPTEGVQPTVTTEA